MTFEEANAMLSPRGAIISIMTDDEKRFLWDTVQRLGGEVIEVGSAYGGTAILLALAGAARVHTVDNWLCGKKDEFTANLQACGVTDRVVPIAGDSTDAVRRFANDAYSLVLIDGAHDAPWPALDLAMYAPKVRTGGVLAVDDTDNGHPAITDALQTWEAEHPNFICIARFMENNRHKMAAFCRVT